MRFKSHVKLFLSIAYHDKTIDAWADLRLRAMYVELLRLAQERYAGRRGNRVQVLPGDLVALTGEADPDAGWAALQELCAAVGYRIDLYRRSNGGDNAHVSGGGVARAREGGRTCEARVARGVVTVRNFAKKQGIETATQTHKNEEVRTKNKNEEVRSTRTPSGVREARGGKTSPEDFPDDVRALTRRFLEAVRRVYPGVQSPTAAAQLGWLRDMDRLVRLGPPGADAKPVSVEQVDKLLAIVFDPDSTSEAAEFWRSVIRSPRKLRKHWEDILIRLHREQSQARRRTPDGKREQVKRGRDDERRAQAERIARQQRGEPDPRGSGTTGPPPS